VPHHDLLRQLLGPLDDAAVAAWDRAIAGMGGPRAIARAALAERYRDGGALRHLGDEAVAAARVEHGDRAGVVLAARDVLLHELVALDDDELAPTIFSETALTIAALEVLRDPGEHAAQRIARKLPLLAALAATAPAPIEHEAPPAGITPRPLLDHVAVRALGRKLAGLERRDRAWFQRDAALSAPAFARACDVVERVRAAGLLGTVRIALGHLDVAKSADPAARRAWEAAGVDLTIHNVASARLLERRWPFDSAGPVGAQPHAIRELAIALVESHGLAGQSLRGETPRPAFARFIAAVGQLRAELSAHLAVDGDEAVALACDCMHVIDVVDTAAVREGLLDDALLDGLEGVRAWLVARARTASADAARIEAELIRDDAAATGRDDPAAARAELGDRLARLRGGRQRAGEPRAEVDAALAALADDEAIALARALASCQLWYCEAATGGLSPAAQLRVLAASCGAARRAGVDVARPWHAQLRPLVARLAGDGAETRYRRRLVEAVLAPRAVGELMSGAPDDAAAAVLGAFHTTLGGDAAVAIDLRDSEEAGALLTLLAIYETRSSAAFHATLKALCDLYKLRKDEFDRVANEASYLSSMNAARSDKARMLDHVRPGRIVEVGPGGGVVLDLLEERFPDSEIIGLDLSREVIAALQARRARDHRRWQLVEADAFALPEHGQFDSIIYCSVLHEIYSYVEPRFSLDSVRDLLRASWRALAPGGRLVIRDGVAPPPGLRRVRFLAADGREFFELFAAQFEGLRLTWRDLLDGRVELDAHQAMEFLYTYTWGPDSFPYEVREQYGILSYDQYAAAILEWLPGARLVPLPAGHAHYLQQGYVDALAPKIELTDELDRPVPFPDSNCLIVVEKR